MQNKELCLRVEAIANEKRISQDEVFFALEEALATACEKEKHTKQIVRVHIDKETGNFHTFRRWFVVEDGAQMVDEEEFNPEYHIEKSKAGDIKNWRFLRRAN